MKWLKRFLALVILILLTYVLHTTFMVGVKNEVKNYLSQLEKALQKDGYNASYLVFSARRFKWQNDFLVAFGGAASKSKHLTGQALDIIVFDVNEDGKYDSKDVDIVYFYLNEKIIKNRGGIGTYKKEKGFFNRQMVHFDSRGHRARWHR